MPPPSDEVFDVQPGLLKDEFERAEREEQEKKKLRGETINNVDPKAEAAEKEMRLLMFVLKHRAFFRLFVEQLSPENKIREIWDRVAKGPERAIEALGADRSQYQFRDEAEKFVEMNDPEAYTALTEALEELAGEYEAFNADLKSYIELTDPEAATELMTAIDNNDMDKADHIIETFGSMRNSTSEW